MSFDFALYGCGNMGQAILKAVYEANLFNHEKIVVIEKDEEKLKSVLNTFLKVSGSTEPTNALIALLAVKPFDVKELARLIVQNACPEIVVSIAAGISIGTLKEIFPERVEVFRAMPNLAATVGQSATAVTFRENVKKDSIKRVRDLLNTFGEVYLVDEGLLDLITAVSGSGPAYFAYLAQKIADAAVELGLEKDLAVDLVCQTLFGSALLVKKGTEFSELIARVSSPKGTTVAALSALDSHNFEQVIKDAVNAAFKRARELAGS
jgi:pyrroline-5-carboxylate reductase